MRKQDGNAALALLALVGVILLIMAVTAGGWAWKYFTAEPRGVADAEQQIEGASSRITNYEHYYDLCALVQSREDAISVQKEQLEAAESSSERERIRSNLAGLKSQRSRAIRQYNADARKSYTSARFLGEDLPRELNTQTENTQCVY